MATPQQLLLSAATPSHAQPCQAGREACSTDASPSPPLSSAQLKIVDQCVEILLVEDNPDDEMLSMHAFKAQQIADKVHVVRDGAEALEFVFCTGAYANRGTKNPKLILLDQNLPLVDGIDVLRRIRSDPRTRLIPVVMLTASGEEGDVVETYALGVNGYIVKPLNSDQFNEAVIRLGYFSLLMDRQPNPATGSAPEVSL